MAEITKLDELLAANDPDYVPPAERDDDEVPPSGQEGRPGFGGQTMHNMANHPVVKRKVERQKAWIEHMRLGKSVVECCEAVGVTRRTYDNWRQADDWFKPAVDGARRELAERDLAAEGKLDRDYDGSFKSFRRIFMGMDTYPHQEELVDLLENADPMSVTLVTFPPEHGKTSTVEDYICWKLGEDADFRFGFVSEKQHHGKKVIGRVQHRMTDHRFAKYQGRFGPFEPGEQGLDLPWRSEYMTVAGRSSDERDYSLVATGWKTAVSGSRYDKLLIDDVQSTKSLTLTDDIAKTLRQDHFTRVGKGGAIVLIATRVGEGDVYSLLMDEGVIDNHVKYPAVRAKADPTCPACDGSGTVGDPETDPDMPPAVIKRGGWTCNCRVLCPEMWDGRSLDLRRKQVGELTWWTTYQQAPQAASRSTFDKSMLEGCRREDLHVGAVALPSDRYPRSVLLGLDPALDGGNALTALACSQTDAIIVDIQVDYGLAQTERIIAGIEDFASRYKPREVVIEQMAFQKGLVNDERLREMANTYGFHIIGHETRLNKHDSNIGVASMDRSFMRREFIIPDGDETTRAVFAELYAQLLAWKPNVATKLITQDAVMSLWFAWKRWMETRRSLHTAEADARNHSIKRNGLPYSPAPGRLSDMRVGTTAGRR